MNTFRTFPIHVEPLPTVEDETIAKSIAYEIYTLQERLLKEGKDGTIDLRTLPAVNATSLAWLEKWLPRGEVSAYVTSHGVTEVRETIYSGVWWIVHKNAKGDIVTEWIQVTYIPDILKSCKEDIQQGWEKLGKWLTSLN